MLLNKQTKPKPLRTMVQLVDDFHIMKAAKTNITLKITKLFSPYFLKVQE